MPRGDENQSEARERSNPNKRSCSGFGLDTAKDYKRFAREFGTLIENRLNEKDERYKVLEEHLNEKDERCKVLEDRLNKKNEGCKVLEERLNKKTERCKVLFDRLNEKGERCKVLEDRLNKKDELYKVLESHLKEKDERFKVLEKRVIEGELQFQEKETALVNTISLGTEMIENELRCSICSELFINAVTLCCAHSFCEFCIKKWMSESEERVCPLCRKRIESFVPSLVLDNFISRYFATDSISAASKMQRQKMIAKRVKSLVRYA